MNAYNSSSIQVLEGLDPVRLRPGMYTDCTRPNHLAQEVIDNAVDEAFGGHATAVDVVLHEDGSLSVEDNGRGMPVDMHATEKKPAVEVILTKLHAGGKFDDKAYGYSGGLHGVGVSVVNALSESLIVTVWRSKKEHTMGFAGGERVTPLVSNRSEREETGTRVRFKADPKYFDHPAYSISRLEALLAAKAVLCPGLRVSFRDEKHDTIKHWCYPDGGLAYLLERLGNAQIDPEKPLVFTFQGDGFETELTMAWQDEGATTTESYVNGIPTTEGGSHVQSLATGLASAFRAFAERRKRLPKDISITSNDAIHNLSFLLALKLKDAQFAGQTKERLTAKGFTQGFISVIKDRFETWLNQHVEIGERLTDRVIEAAAARQKSKAPVLRKTIRKGPLLPGKLADCRDRSLDSSELFIVEGDSAGGSAKQARNNVNQAILPIRGKILNAWECTNAQAMASKEVSDLAMAIGLVAGQEDTEGLRYGKVCILADADSDGLHIATLLAALFYRHFPALVAGGHLFCALPPLYRIDIGEHVFYALDDAERQAILQKATKDKLRGKVSFQRFKGLGEMNPSQLRETTIDPAHRRLLPLLATDLQKTTQAFDRLLAKGAASDRRTWIESFDIGGAE